MKRGENHNLFLEQQKDVSLRRKKRRGASMQPEKKNGKSLEHLE